MHDLAFLIHVQRRDWRAAHDAAIALARVYGTPSEVIRRFVAMTSREGVAAFLKTSEVRTRNEAVRGVIPATRIAVLNALNGHDEEALAWLEQAARNRDAELVFALRDPAFDAIRLADRFRVLDRRIHQS